MSSAASQGMRGESAKNTSGSASRTNSFNGKSDNSNHRRFDASEAFMVSDAVKLIRLHHFQPMMFHIIGLCAPRKSLSRGITRSRFPWTHLGSSQQSRIGGRRSAGGANGSSPRREPWVVVVKNRKSPERGDSGQHSVFFCRPCRGFHGFRNIPTACVVGYFLPARRALGMTSVTTQAGGLCSVPPATSSVVGNTRSWPSHPFCGCR